MEHSGFNAVDLSVLGLLLVSGGLAFLRGFVREIFALGTWVGAAAASVFLYPVARPWVVQHLHIKNEMAASAATGLGIFCLALIILIPIGMLCSNLIRGQTLTAIDRSLGFVFGLVRGLLVLCLLFLGMTFLWPETSKMPDWLAQAKTRPILAYGAEMIRGLVPKDAQEKAAAALAKTRDDAERAAEDAKRLQSIATPAPAAADGKNGEEPSYGDDIRNKLNDLIDKKGQ